MREAARASEPAGAIHPRCHLRSSGAGGSVLAQCCFSRKGEELPLYSHFIFASEGDVGYSGRRVSFAQGF